MTYDQMEAQAFIDLVTDSSTVDPRVPEVIVLVDFDTLLNGLQRPVAVRNLDGIPLPPATVRRLCCQANIIPAVLDGDSQPLDLGRGKRLASPAQRRQSSRCTAPAGSPAAPPEHRPLRDPPHRGMAATQRTNRPRQAHATLLQTPPPRP